MFHLIPVGTKIDFVGKRYIWLALSIVAILGTIGLFFTRGLNYGIDFTGGAELQLSMPKDWDTARFRNELEKGGIKEARIQEAVADSTNTKKEFIMRVQGDEKSLRSVAGQVDGIFSKILQKGEYEIVRSDVVGPAAGGELRKSGFLAMFYALLAILVYVAVRFDTRYAPGAVLALFHDSVFVIGIFILTQKQFDLTVLSALLALIGYSNNDTIIVFDRVRETIAMHPGYTIEQAVNRAVNETLGRTIMTSLTTFLVAFALWMFGGSVLENFAFTFMVGIVVGTYSSIFIASSIIIFITHYRKNQEHKGNTGKKKKRKEIVIHPEPRLGS